MQRLILLVLFVTPAIFSSCGYFVGATVSKEIIDLSQPCEKVMKVKLPKNEYVHKVKVKVTGKANGKFSIEDKVFEGGDINTIIYEGDYYGPEYSVKYQPLDKEKKVTGKLKVYVTFYY